MSTYPLLTPHPLVTYHVTDAVTAQRTMPDKSVHTVMTSPPFYGQRDYKVKGQIGREPTLDEYINKLVELFSETRRVLRDDGTFWFEMGDGYVRGGKFLNKKNTRFAEGNLVGLPWMIAFALRDAGWLVRSENLWWRPNALPEAVHNRPARDHSTVFMLTKQPRYYYDSIAVMVPASANTHPRGKGMHRKMAEAGSGIRANGSFQAAVNGHVDERNLRTVWKIPTVQVHDDHDSTFAPDVARPAVLAGTSAHGCCSNCGAPYTRDAERVSENGEVGWVTHGWKSACTCALDGQPYPVVPCTVLDVFGGSGTTGIVAAAHGRCAVLVELNPDTAKKGAKRVKRELDGMPTPRPRKGNETSARTQPTLFSMEEP